jgi:hypothetical protein
MVLQGERDVPVATESEDSSDIKKDMVLDLCAVVGLFVHVWYVWWCEFVEWACVCMNRQWRMQDENQGGLKQWRC